MTSPRAVRNGASPPEADAADGRLAGILSLAFCIGTQPDEAPQVRRQPSSANTVAARSLQAALARVLDREHGIPERHGMLAKRVFGLALSEAALQHRAYTDITSAQKFRGLPEDPALGWSGGSLRHLK